MPKFIQAKVFVKVRCELGEGPFWHDDHLWWVDIPRGHLHSADKTGRIRTTDSVGQKLGASAPIGNDRFILALEKDLAIFDRKSSSLRTVATHDTSYAGARFNDGKCDPAGRFLAGTLSDSESEPVCALYSYAPDREIGKIREGIILSNGLAWDSQGTTLYYIDSLTYEIAAFVYCIESGSLGAHRVVIRIPPKMGIPDGMDIDVDGNLWIAHWGAASVCCWSPQTGECLYKIALPCTQPTSCCFGGPGYTRLYITTAREGLSDEELSKQPLAGHVFVCEPGTQGFPINVFIE